jgi:hypothetical protein
MGGPGGGAVHEVATVLDKAGTAYISETVDHGTLKSVDTGAGTITIVEGTKTFTYETPTLTIPSGVTVTLDGKTSTLASLSEGDHVTLTSSTDGTSVSATDSSFQPTGGAPGHSGAAPSGSAPAAPSSQ